jgi:predicted phage-related endonuclease
MECKAVFEKPWDEIPSYYQGQGQWQLHATGFERVWFAVLHGRRFRTYELPRDDDDITFMDEAVEAFWHDHVLTRTPPPIDGTQATAEALARVYPEAEPGSAKAIDHIQGAVKDLAKAKADELDAKERARYASNIIKAEMGGTLEGTIGGKTALKLRSQVRRVTCRHCLAVDVSDPYRVLTLKPTTPQENPDG